MTFRLGYQDKKFGSQTHQTQHFLRGRGYDSYRITVVLPPGGGGHA